MLLDYYQEMPLILFVINYHTLKFVNVIVLLELNFVFNVCSGNMETPKYLGTK